MPEIFSGNIDKFRGYKKVIKILLCKNCKRDVKFAKAKFLEFLNTYLLENVFQLLLSEL